MYDLPDDHESSAFAFLDALWADRVRRCSIQKSVELTRRRCAVDEEDGTGYARGGVALLSRLEHSRAPIEENGSARARFSSSSSSALDGEVVAAGFLGAGVEVTPGSRERRVAQRLPDSGQIGATVEGVGAV